MFLGKTIAPMPELAQGTKGTTRDKVVQKIGFKSGQKLSPLGKGLSQDIIAKELGVSVTEFFDDIQGEAYENFKDSIQRRGILSPLIVAPDMTVISGHQRLKAAQELGLRTVPVDIREDAQEENDKLELLLVANFGREKNDEIKKRKVAVEYVRLRGMAKGSNQHSIVDNRLSMKDIAKQLGTSETNLKELLLIERKLTPEIKEILDAGGINKTTASKILVKLSPEEQRSLLEELGRDQLTAMTQKQVQELFTSQISAKYCSLYHLL